MKKFIISEEEKNRILGMHVEATKKHYGLVNEQPVEKSSESLVPDCKDTYTYNGKTNLGCITNRKPYYVMMRQGKKPNVVLTYKYDGKWFDAHTYTNMFDMATEKGVSDEKLADIFLGVRKGIFGVNPTLQGNKIFIGPDAQEAATNYPEIDQKLARLSNYMSDYSGKGSPR